jgi:hypothetical protein
MPVFAAGQQGGDLGVGHPTYGRRKDFGVSHSAIFYIPDFLGAPQNFRIDSCTPTTVRLAWTNPASFVTFIEIDRAIGDGSFVLIARVPFSQTTYTDSGLTKGTRYRYRLRVV